MLDKVQVENNKHQLKHIKPQLNIFKKKIISVTKFSRVIGSQHALLFTKLEHEQLRSNNKVSNNTLGAGRTSAISGKTSLKLSKSFRLLLFNHETARVFTSTPRLSRQHSAMRIRHVAQQRRDENRGLSPVCETVFCHQLVLVPETEQSSRVVCVRLGSFS